MSTTRWFDIIGAWTGLGLVLGLALERNPAYSGVPIMLGSLGCAFGICLASYRHHNKKKGG